MSTDVITASPDEPASAAWTRMERENVRHLIVVEGKRLVGVISERDLGGPRGAAARRGRTVGDLMTAQVAVAKPDTTLRRAANLMHSRLIGSLPVVENGRLVGIVTATDVLQELGRGSTRPTVRAQRQSMRLPPASARRARRASTKTAPVTAGAKGAAGRGRRRNPDSARRAPMAASVPRPARRVAGRTEAADTPAHVRASGAALKAADKDYLRRKLGRKLGKFAPAIERASVRVDDVNGPRGGVDKRYRIKVVVSGLPSVVVEESHHSLRAAMDGALARVGRAVRNATKRRQMKPRRPRRTPSRISRAA